MALNLEEAMDMLLNKVISVNQQCESSARELKESND